MPIVVIAICLISLLILSGLVAIAYLFPQTPSQD